MPQHIADARRIQGRFQQDVMRRLGPQAPVARPRDGAFARGPLNVSNAASCVVAGLMLSSALQGLRLAERPSPRAALPQAPRGPAPAMPRPSTSGQPPRTGAAHAVHAAALRPELRLAARQMLPAVQPALLRGAAATGRQVSYSRMELTDPQGAGASLTNVANGVMATCVTRPADCTKAIIAGTLAGLGVVAASATAGMAGFALGRASAPECPEAAVPVAERLPESHTLLDLLPPDDRQQVLEVIRHCAGAPDCAIPEIRTLLRELPPAVKQQLMAQVPGGDAGPTAGWPPGAEAAVFPPGVNWMDHLADVLGTQISAEQAAYELDIAAIVDATLASQEDGGYRGWLKQAANDARRDAIFDLFDRDGFNVEERPFHLNSRTLFGAPYTARGSNLLVTLSGAGEPQRTVMLVAHGDMVAAEIGGTGALDNGGGVAALLAVARRLQASGLPAGTRVQFMVSGMEESGLLGAKAHVEQCLDAGDCADVALNLDLVTRGDGMALSGSDTHVLYRDGDSSPRGADASEVRPAEARMMQLLRAAAATVGQPVHDTPDWTLQSDHIAFQRRNLSAVGISLMDAADVAPERERQQARLAYLQAEENVNWDLYQPYMAGALNASTTAEMERAIGVADNITTAYQALPLSGRESLIHSAADQPWRIDVRQALRAIDVVHRAVSAYLSAPPARTGA